MKEYCEKCDSTRCDHVHESATTPAEVDVPTIGRDEAFQRDYIPLGRSGWEIQTKGKGSTYRICEPDGHRLAIPNEPYLHETLTRMARDVHADYAALARQLAEAKAEIERRTSDMIDARRYRWLRDPNRRIDSVIDKVTGHLESGFPIYEYRAGEELDAAIDARLASET